MNTIHIFIGIATVLLSLATVIAAFVPKVKEETFDQLIISTAGLLIVQIAVGFFMFTNGDSDLNIFHIILPVASLAAILGARSVHGDRKKMLVVVAALFVMASAVYSYISGVQAADKV